MPELYHIILTGGVICSSLIVLLLLRFGRKQLLSNLLLSIAVFVSAWYAAIYVLITSGVIIQVPNLYNKGIPLYYLFAPCCFLYVYFTLHPGKKMTLKDGLHFLPATLAIIDMLPYAFASEQVKREIIQYIVQDVSRTYQHRLAFIPQSWHYILRLIQGIIYNGVQWALLLTFADWRTRQPALKRWLFSFTILISVLNLLLLIISIKALIDPETAPDLLTHSVPMVGTCIIFFLLSVGLFFWPEVLYGTYNKQSPKKPLSSHKPKVCVPTGIHGEADHLVLTPGPDHPLQRLHQYLENTQIFRQEGLTIHELAIKAEMPSYQLSSLLNELYNQHFNTYINTWRVNYLIHRLEQGDSKAFTLESLAKDAGFSSRNAFYTAFKKITGLTPSAYLSRIK